MYYARPIVISIAGFDPSGGAGILADIKTFEQHRCLGMGVLSALTVQTENRFLSVEWRSSAQIIEQLRPLLADYPCGVIKFGIIKDLAALEETIDFIHSVDPEIKVIWDPVLSASAGFELMREMEQERLNRVLGKLFLVTPNTHEAIKLGGAETASEAAVQLAKHGVVLLKGGHNDEQRGVDRLYTDDRQIEFAPSAGQFAAKHGSGCILSAAIAANLANGKPLEAAIAEAKKYIEKILNSTEQLLAYHV